MKAIVVLLCLTFASRVNTQDIFGYWKSVDSNKGFTTSVIAVYEYQNRVYGQLVITFNEKNGELINTINNPIQKAEKVKGKPLLLKICLFWDLEKKGVKYKGGTILDPRSGLTYGCELWTSDGLLVIRGLVGPFGMNELFYPTTDSDFPTGFQKPSLSSFIPVRP